MKVVVFVIALAFFLAGLALFGFAFQFEGIEGFVFFAGIISVCISIAIPVHLLKRIDA